MHIYDSMKAFNTAKLICGKHIFSINVETEADTFTFSKLTKELQS
jgi:hypothetical protein